MLTPSDLTAAAKRRWSWLSTHERAGDPDRDPLGQAARCGACPSGAKNGNFKNGFWTADAMEERRWLRSLVRSFANNETTE